MLRTFCLAQWILWGAQQKKAGQVPDLGKPPMLRRDTFNDILADEEEEVPVNPKRRVRFAKVPTSTPVPRPMKWPRERTQSYRVSKVPSTDEGLIRNLEPQKELFEEGFSHSLQAAAIKFKKLQVPKLAKFKGGYSSDASLVFQSWLKDIWIYTLECYLSQWEAI